MNKKSKIILNVIIILFILLVFLFTGCLNHEKNVEISKDEIIKIQQLINEASNNDEIYIPSATYYENIIIDKPIKLIGDNKDNTIIDGGGKQEIILIKSDNVIISNITIRNSGGYTDNAGIKVLSDNLIINDCIFYRTKTGIYFDQTENNLISNCIFHTNGEGIYSYNSKNTVIKDSQFYHNSFGLNIDNSENININKSYVHTNGIGIYGRNAKDVELNQCSICNNNQDGGGIWLFDCKNFNFYNCNVNYNGVGLKLKNSNSKISYSNFNQNMYNAILLEDSNDVIISNCNIKNSFRTALFVDNSDFTLINSNIVGSTLYGLEFDRNSIFDVRNNWWGSKSGPSLTEYSLGEKISYIPWRIKLIPWKTDSIGKAGADFSTKDIFNNLETPLERYLPIEFAENDMDKDGAPDWWEEKWGYNPNIGDDHINLDPDNDSLNNIEECYTDKYNSNPFYRDIFIEIDWLKNPFNNNKPSNEFIEKAIKIFQDHEINLHIDIGNLDGGEEIPLQSLSSVTEIRDIYWNYFLHNNLDNPRKGIFRYCLIINDNEEVWGGFVFFGWDHLDTIGICIERIQNNNKLMKRDQLIIGGMIHELGHLLGLTIDDYGGIDNTGSAKFFTLQGLKYKNYLSCLNYRYVYHLLSYSDGTHGKRDFNDWDNLDFGYFKDTNIGDLI